MSENDKDTTKNHQESEESTVGLSQCDCYECIGSEFRYTDDGHRFVKNNLKKHTQFEPCEDCGRPKTEYLDLGRKGYYVCWWCHERGGGTGSEPAADQHIHLAQAADKMARECRRFDWGPRPKSDAIEFRRLGFHHRKVARELMGE